ncbi:uncharacterized protein PHALS_05820 [Plasmopara halstedii]|uniref:Uncharacterized protein n=1 Tax=Plasmopara halstedii TaxID=4781 RepID=A0A0P1AAW4_PLAHL|nr:uncharacterized protein PHALS_05820 [Plasmopara halstedii]CEG37765.1 hypothetical protein PHALS_05820 [Plasmopara halstedii]|eukprot:XP_024574134.1 hypothetical protein PHALS_05820 [Plasmopara halstedii]
MDGIFMMNCRLKAESNYFASTYTNLYQPRGLLEKEVEFNKYKQIFGQWGMYKECFYL